MGDEIDWPTVTAESGSQQKLEEKTTVTGRVRRVARFDMGAVVRACRLNGATELCVTFVDYVATVDSGVTDFNLLTSKSRDLIADIERETGLRVTLISTGPETRHMIDRR
jgi:adenylosuccinate synthase